MNLSNFMAMAYSTKKIGDRKNFSDLDYSPLVTRLEEHVTLAKGFAIFIFIFLEISFYHEISFVCQECIKIGVQALYTKNVSASHLHFGKYVTALYLVVKFLWLLNIIAQFVILDLFLGPQYTFWGLGILNDLIYNRHWSISGHFPRVFVFFNYILVFHIFFFFKPN